MDPITASVVTGITIATISGAMLAWMKRRWAKVDKKEIKNNLDHNEIKELQRSIWRLNKTVLIMAKIIDDQTVKVHTELISSLEDIANELLTDTKG